MKTRWALSALIYTLISSLLLAQINIVAAGPGPVSDPITAAITSVINTITNPPSDSPSDSQPSPTPTATPTYQLINPKVYLLIYNPTINSQTLTQLKGWNDPVQLTQTFIDDIKQVSGGLVNYSIVQTNQINDFPVKTDGFKYTNQSYLDCVSSGGSNCHNPDLSDYQKFIADNQICEKRNNGEIDELWVWGGPWFGYYESNLTGPNAFWYNSSPTLGTTCNKLLPIMGFNYERGEAEMLEDLGHRAESTMIKVYGPWKADETTTWNRFSLLDADKPGRGGCGNAHLSVNAPTNTGYDRTSTRTVASSCDDFLNYPDLTNTYSSINCSAWGCDTVGYLKWWFSHLPRAKIGNATDGKLTNWWKYIINPQDYLFPTTTPTPSPSATPNPSALSDPDPVATPSASPKSAPLTAPVIHEINPTVAHLGDIVSVKTLWNNLTGAIAYVGNILMPTNTYQLSDQNTTLSFILDLESGLQAGFDYYVRLIDQLGISSNSVPLTITAPVVNPTSTPQPTTNPSATPEPSPTATPSANLVPVITSLSPNPATQGTIVTITGNHFGADSRVYVNQTLMPVEQTIVSPDSTSLTFNLTAEANFQADETYPVQVVNSDGESNQFNLIIAPSLVQNVATPSASQVLIAPSVTLDTDHPQVIIASSNFNSTINVPSNVINPTLDFSHGLQTNGEIKTAIFNNILNVNSNTPLGIIKVAIPALTQISGPSDWNGIMNTPQILANSTATATADLGTTATTQAVLEVGFGDIPLTFDKAVRVLIPKQAGRLVGYTRGNNFYKITQNCSADSQTVGDNLGNGSDCFISTGNDLVIWTKHFTKFMTYTQTQNPTQTNNSSSSQSANGGSTPFAPTCGDSKPVSAPKIVSVLASGRNEVTLIWEKALDPVSYYLVAYGTKPGVLEYGNPNVGGRDTTSYVVKGLGANKAYYFKVRAGNGCMPGDYSGEVMIKASGDSISTPAIGFKSGVLGSTKPEVKFKPITSAKPNHITTSSTSFLAKAWTFLVNLFSNK